MHKKQITLVLIFTVIVAAVLTIHIVYTINSVNNTVTNACFNDLTDVSESLANDLKKTTEMDRTTLTAMAAVIESGDKTSDKELCSVLNSFNSEASYISYVELLCPDNTILSSDGSRRSVKGIMDFDEIAKKGSYITDIKISTLHPGEKVIRNVVPVKKGDKTQYILFGTVRLSDLATKYKTDFYNGHAYSYLIDGNTGDFLLDTWHKTLGNIADVDERTMLPGFSFDKATKNLKKGIGGDLSFVSKTTGEVLYMHYAPVGVNNWSVAVTVQQQYAFSESDSVSKSLYSMSIVVGSVLLIYMVFITACLLRAYRKIKEIGLKDQTTQLLNRNAYDTFITKNKEFTFETIACIYVDANGLHEINNRYGHAVGDQMLRFVADALKEQFKFKSIYRIGGDEFVVFNETDDVKVCSEKIENVKASLKKHDYSVSAGIVYRENEIGVDRIIREADEKMLQDKQEYYEINGERDER